MANKKNRYFTVRGINYQIDSYRPRNNEFEKGLKYIVLVERNDGTMADTGIRTSTIKKAKEFVERNPYDWM